MLKAHILHSRSAREAEWQEGLEGARQQHVSAVQELQAALAAEQALRTQMEGDAREREQQTAQRQAALERQLAALQGDLQRRDAEAEAHGAEVADRDAVWQHEVQSAHQVPRPPKQVSICQSLNNRIQVLPAYLLG